MTSDQKFTIRRALLKAAGAGALFGIAAPFAPSFSAEPKALAKPVKLVIGAAKVGHLAPLVKAPELLKPLNVDLEIVDFVRYADARTAIATGSLDLATVGPADLPLALSQGITDIIALMGVGSSAKYVVARNGVKLNSWEDLRGKKIAIAPGSAVWFQFVATLIENDIDYNEINAVNIQGGGANFDQALQRGDVDAIITWEPFESIPVVNGYGYWAKNLDYSKSKAVGAELGMIAASRNAIDNKLLAIKHFIYIYVQEQNRLNNNKEAFAKAIAQFTGISNKISDRIAGVIHLSASLPLNQLERQAKTFNKLGVIQSDVSAELPEYYKGNLVQEVTSN